MSGRPAKGGGASAGRRSLRDRKVSQRMAVVDESARQQATQARLDALENDNEPANDQFDDRNVDDDEFALDGDASDEEIGANGKRVKKKKAGKRKLRGGVAAARQGPKNFARVLEEAELERLPASTPSYATATAGPGQRYATRKFCTVCGNSSAYTCVRCGSRYCCRRCYNTHSETRCLKFIG